LGGWISVTRLAQFLNCLLSVRLSFYKLIPDTVFTEIRNPQPEQVYQTTVSSARDQISLLATGQGRLPACVISPIGNDAMPKALTFVAESDRKNDNVKLPFLTTDLRRAALYILFSDPFNFATVVMNLQISQISPFFNVVGRLTFPLGLRCLSLRPQRGPPASS
jgi:hypothetical protein